MLHERFTNTKHPAFGPEIEAEAKIEEGDRLVCLSFSSEIPVLRETAAGPAYEVLGHDSSEVELGRLNTGSAPVLKDHRRDVDSMVGTVVSAQIEGRRGRAIVRLADTKEGNSMLSRVRAGEVQSVSVGWLADKGAVVSKRKGGRAKRSKYGELIDVGDRVDQEDGIGYVLALVQGFIERPDTHPSRQIRIETNGLKTAGRAIRSICKAGHF